jgi:hypothetical protein
VTAAARGATPQPGRDEETVLWSNKETAFERHRTCEGEQA